MQLTADDRQICIRLLSEVPEFDTPDGRRELLRGAGLDTLARRIDTSGAPYIAASRTVSFLLDYGRVSDDHHALGVLLSFVKPMVGREQQKFVDGILMRYGLMTPVASTADVGEWRGPTSMAAIAEKIIGENTLRPVAYLEGGITAAKAVAYIGVAAGDSTWSGTGFLVSPDLLLTNNHVVCDAAQAKSAQVRFNYENDLLGRARPIEQIQLDETSLVHTDPDLDYTVLRVPGSPGERYGWLKLSTGAPSVRQRVAIIQHPGGQAKQIAMQHNQIEYVGEDVVQYVTSTLPGSSGSPVLNDDWDVLAIHHAGGHLTEPETGRVFFRNEGIRASSLRRELAAVVSPADLQHF